MLKLFALGLCAISLSACAFTQGVAQSAYDEQADKNCSSQYGGEVDSIHRTANSRCSNGEYVPKDLSKYEPKDDNK